MTTEKFADVILPLAVEGSFTYRIPEELAGEVVPGSRVIVPLGRRKYYAAIVHRIHTEKPDYKTIKSVVSAVDTRPIVTEHQLKLWDWIASYYMCSMGEVMKSAIPSAFKSDGYSENITDSYTVKTRTHLTFSAAISSEKTLHEALDSLKRAKAQYKALIDLAELLSPVDFGAPGSVTKSDFVQAGHASYPVLKALEAKGFLRSFEKEVSRNEAMEAPIDPMPVLTGPQEEAFRSVRTHFGMRKTVLLHGVTGSGKTEIYIHLIREALDTGKDVLYLLPEIALTTQLIERLRLRFGDRVAVYHSRFSDNMRAECYLQVLEEDREPLLIVGARSALLLPHRRLGLVLVDEEHENSYKQYEPAPRYHARDSALMLARISGAASLLGSATPSVESYFNAVTGKYGLVTLTERYGGVSLPNILVSDIIRSARRGERTSLFNRVLLEELDKTLAAGKQAILFQNRRGFAPYTECGACYFVPTCPHCNVSLTYHKATESLTCHYCGYAVPVPPVCPACGAADLQTKGFGTEKIEEELQKIFPQAVIARLDLDSTRSAKGYSRIVSAFAAGKTDILVGTQMVTKGFDFENVTLVGILNADNMLNFPDFRASERSFQLMMQVAGRAGRRNDRGQVIIQTTQPDHPVILQVREGNYEALFRTQIAERQQFLYPPYCRLVRFTLKHAKKEVLNRAVTDFDRAMRKIFGKRLLGPEIPAVDKIRNEYLCGFLLKIERGKSFAEARRLASEAIRSLLKKEGYASLTIIPDVDPQ